MPLSGKFTLGARGTYWGTTYSDAGQQTSTLVTTMVSETSGQTAVNVAMAAAGLPSGSGEVIENHYLFPQAKILRHHFDRVGINIDDYTIPLERTRHRFNPNGIHTNNGGNWNRVWEEFFRENPLASREEIFEQLYRMRSAFGI